MTLPVYPNSISLNQVNVELSRSGTTNVSLDESAVRTLAGKPSGTIAMSDLHGKSAVNYGSLTPSVSTVAEGGSVTFTLAGGTAPAGTYYWRVFGGTASPSDFSSTSGSFSVASNTGNFSVSVVNDYVSEGNETFIVEVSDTNFGTVRATSSSVTITNNQTYTAALVSNPNPYRWSGYNAVSCALNTTWVSAGTTIYWGIEQISGVTVVSPTDINATTGSFTLTSTGGANCTGTASVTVAAVTDGTSRGAGSFRFAYYTDAGRTVKVAHSGTIGIYAAPTYTNSVSPTSISEGGSTTWTVNAGNLPISTLYFTTSGTASATSDLIGASASGSVTIPASVSFTGTLDGSTEGSETLNIQLRTLSTAGSIVATATLTINDALGSITTLVLTVTGGTVSGQAVSMTAQITSIPAYPAARTFNITYSQNGGAWTNAGLIVSTVTVNANATSSNAPTIWTASAPTNLWSTTQIRATATGHNPATSNTVTNRYIN